MSSTLDRNWLPILNKYWEPSPVRSIIELIITGVPFVALWLLALWSLSISYWLTLAISIPASGFLVRLFLIQHDCGHGAFFRKRITNDWVGRVLGVFSLTPYYLWRKQHATHHAGSGNLHHRGIGDIDTLTVVEYQAKSPMGRFGYRVYRHPLVLFAIGPAYNFWLRQRLPMGFMRAGWRYWASAMTTNLAIFLVIGVLIYFIGFGRFLAVHVPISLIATSIGVWLFYVQHQFEDTYWSQNPDWKLQDAALKGSSHYDLPLILRWFTANIGVHHVHHLNARIPYYRLTEVLRDFPELADVSRLTLRESFKCINLGLWDETQQKLIPFRQANISQG
ncbi:Beta-carotene ketolase [hydrothermal vent metagenome]|uniref:Beta-carotene ketolase n=1 Tax=hydrothermal vent metagenome TaxID=652676 RepID=A0A3B0RC29_9ZZZZ